MNDNTVSRPDGRQRVAFVSGGRRGIGQACVWALAEAGFDVVINDIVDDEAMARTRDGVVDRGRKCATAIGDIADIEHHDELVARAWSSFGAVHCLVNNAGVGVLSRGDLLDVTPESYDRCLSINLRGHFFLTQSFSRRMIELARVDDTYRSIICISSCGADIVSISRGEYCISKAGMAMLARLFAVRLAEHQIGVHEVRPGIVRTDMNADPKIREKWVKLIADGVSPIRRFGDPEDVGRAVACLASGAFAFSTGSAFELDGGLHLNRL